MSPRAVGIGVVCVGVAGSATAAFCIAAPAWGLIAAMALAVAATLTAYGALLIARKSWADKTWPPGGQGRPIDTRRVRLLTRVYGIFLLAMSVVAAVGILAIADASADELFRMWIIVAVIACAGAALTVMAWRSSAPAVVDDDIPNDGPRSDAAWVQLGHDGSATSVQRLTIGGAVGQPLSSGPFVVMLLFPTLLHFDGWFGVVLVAIALAILVIVWLAMVLGPSGRAPLVARDGSRVRTASKTVRATEIAAAHLVATPVIADATRRSLTIVLEGPNSFRAPVGIRKHGSRVLSADAAFSLLALIEQSSIDLPRDKEDPRGRFSRVLYPAHLTRQQVAQLIEDPPGDGEPLPTSTGASGA